MSRLYRTLSTLDKFVDNALGLTAHSETLSGFHYNRDLIYAAVANTYFETVGTRADSLHLAIKRRDISDICNAQLGTVRVIGRRSKISDSEVILAIDCTDENFYGKLESMWIHTWTGEKAVTGKFKFLTCALICGTAPLKVPVLSLPVPIGCDTPSTIFQCMDKIEPLFKDVLLTIFDRGFYIKELMYEMDTNGYKYLIFVPKNKKIQKELSSMSDAQTKTTPYEFEFCRNKTTVHGKTTLAFLKQIYDTRTENKYDWTFATNKDVIELDSIIKEYRKRWRIETMFRVQDEARILTKSKDVKIRTFYFIYAQILQLLWAGIFKEEVSFKEFLILLNEIAKERDKKAQKKNGKS